MNRVAYRFVVPERNTEDNFKPLAVMEKMRVNTGKFVNCSRSRCSADGLSFFAEQAQAVVVIKKLIATHKKRFLDKKGSAIAQVTLRESHGMATVPDKKSHVDLHQFEEARFDDQEMLIVWRHAG